MRRLRGWPSSFTSRKPPPAQGGPQGAALLALAAGLGLLAYLFLASGWPWLLLALVALVALGTDSLLRSRLAAPSAGPADTAPYILLPSLMALTAGLLTPEVAQGAWKVLAAALAALALGLAAYAEYLAAQGPPEGSLQPLSAGTQPVVGGLGLGSERLTGAYLFLQLLGYLTAFALFAFVEVALQSPFAIPATGLVATLVAVELLRGVSLDTARYLALAGAIGLLLLEASWALYWASLPDLAAALLLMLLFYLATGLVLSYRRGQLTWSMGAEFGAVGVLGLGLALAAGLMA